MYTEQQAIALKKYYLQLLPEWEIDIVFPIQPNDSIIGATPSNNESYNLLFKKGGTKMLLTEACSTLNLPEPYQIKDLLNTDLIHPPMRQFPIIVVLKDGTEIQSKEHELVNWHHVNITACTAALNKKLLHNETANIYVMESNGKVFTETPDGTTFEYYR